MDCSPQQDKNNVEELDHALQAILGKFTSGISPAALMLALTDWYTHLLIHPAKQLALAQLAQDNYWKLLSLIQCQANMQEPRVCTRATKNDNRFTDDAWQEPPYFTLYQSFLLLQDWWHAAATNVRGVSKHHEDVVDFTLRQILDMFSPSNFILANPEVKKATLAEHGENFVKGFDNFVADVKRYEMDAPPEGAENFIIGENVAVTAGSVIYRNQLIELIQYSPTTDEVYANPILITPAWIMKYYILDLTPKHSLVKYLVAKGHSVFMISWKNPTKDYRNTSMQDYIELGILAALDIISSLIPKQKIHLVGYCLGGTLAAITTALMARENDTRLASMTMFAAQTDFTEPGELGLFIDESQIAFLENMMRENGYLDTHQMAGTFQLLRSNDLVWSRMVHDYLLGKRKPLTDLMAWNADATRLPYKMHSEYLRKLFLNNELASGKYEVQGKPIALTDITVPVFVVATERDHVSPWHSVFKINLLTNSDVTFALTSGGHNVGIVSMPVKKTKRHYRISTLKESDRYIDAESWYEVTKSKNGSWWPAWEKWLSNLSGEKVSPPAMGENLMDAPGSYVLEK